MGTFCITRKEFLDRALDVAELAALADMLHRWYLLGAPGLARPGQIWCEARIYAFARAEEEGIRNALSARLPAATVGSSSSGELIVTGTARLTGVVPAITVWRDVLAEPRIEHACVLLRLTIEGPVVAFNGSAGDATQTFVLCGAPANGEILLKAIWEMGQDESMQLVYRAAVWPSEAKLLEAFKVYLNECAAGRPDSAAAVALELFGDEIRHLFRAREDERKVMWLLRQKAELPDDRRPAAFARRLSLPLLGGVCLAALPAVLRASRPVLVVSLLVAAYLLLRAWRIAWNKLQYVRTYYTAMRAGLGKLYSKPTDYRVIDLSADKTPTLLKSSAELESLGARHVCDVSITTARSVLDGNRVYCVGDSAATIALLRKAESLLFFPPKPIVILTTRFVDGRVHYTTNRPIYRKQSRPQTTAKCLSEDGEVDEAFALHRRHVDKLNAAGAVPLPPATTPDQVLERMRREHEEARVHWERSPYSWGDALHDGFKVCRREYLDE